MVINLKVINLPAEIEEIMTESTLKVLVSEGSAQVGLAVLQPGEKIPEQGFSSHDVEEISYLFSGKIKMETGQKTEIINSGDLVYNPADKQHRTTNISQEAAVVLWFAPESLISE